MSDLDERDRALLELAGSGHDPTDEDRARNRRKLARRLGAAAGLGVATTIASPSSSAATLFLSKWVVGLAALTVVGGAAWTALAPAASIKTAANPSQPLVTAAVTREAPTVRSSPAPRLDGTHATSTAIGVPTPSAPSVPAGVRGTKQDVPPRGAATHVVNEPEAAEAFMPHPPARVEPAPAVVVVPPMAAPGAPPSSQSSLEEEMRLIHAGMVALHDGRAIEALARFDEHAARFPRGELAEDRDAKRVLALCMLGRMADVHTAVASFGRTYPSSALLSRVQTSCPAADAK